MTSKIIVLITRYREQISYLIVGCITTLVNYIAFALLTHIAGFYYLLSNIAAWTAAVIFSYFANGQWVYRSASRRSLQEAVSFVLSRLFSLGLETLLLFLLVSLLGIGEMAAKLLLAALVVVVNYLTGLLVFKSRKGA
ncbi:MAG: GtrA family protein [Oscillibacter sp.]|nr:GtrA family protein [Oscillibacter sp.]